MAKEIQSDEFKKLLSLGEEKGFLTYDDVNDLLPPDVNSSEQIDDIIIGDNILDNFPYVVKLNAFPSTPRSTKRRECPLCIFIFS